MRSISNSAFLENYLEATMAGRQQLAGEFILPFEQPIIETQIEAADERKRAAMAEPMDHGWHSGSAMKNDCGVLGLDKTLASLNDRLRGTVVGYPGEDEDRITLGSRVIIMSTARGESVLDIVGYAKIHDREDRDAIPASLEAALVQPVIGKRVGETAMSRLGEVEIKAIDQTAIRQMGQQA